MTVSIVKPTVGGDSGTWGQELNAALDAIVVGINNLEGVLGSNYLTATAVSTLLAGYATSAQLGTFIAKPVSGDAVGSVPTKQSNGTVAYVVPTGGSTVSQGTDGNSYLSSSSATVQGADGNTYLTIGS